MNDKKPAKHFGYNIHANKLSCRAANERSFDCILFYVLESCTEHQYCIWIERMNERTNKLTKQIRSNEWLFGSNNICSFTALFSWLTESQVRCLQYVQLECVSKWVFRLICWGRFLTLIKKFVYNFICMLNMCDVNMRALVDEKERDTKCCTNEWDTTETCLECPPANGWKTKVKTQTVTKKKKYYRTGTP